jgi:hypothetical protein
MGRRSGGARRRSADASARRRIRAARSGSDFEVGGGSGEPPGRRGKEGEWRRLHARVSRRHLTGSWGGAPFPRTPPRSVLLESGVSRLVGPSCQWKTGIRSLRSSVDWDPEGRVCYCY